MPISKVYSDHEARKLGFFEDEKEGPEHSLKKVSALSWVYPDQYELLERAFGKKVPFVVTQRFEQMLEELYEDAEKELDRRNELYDEELA